VVKSDLTANVKILKQEFEVSMRDCGLVVSEGLGSGNGEEYLSKLLKQFNISEESNIRYPHYTDYLNTVRTVKNVSDYPYTHLNQTKKYDSIEMEMSNNSTDNDCAIAAQKKELQSLQLRLLREHKASRELQARFDKMEAQVLNLRTTNKSLRIEIEYLKGL